MNLPEGYETDSVIRLETNLDDLSPEVAGAVMEKLFGAGALDVWFTPIQMKKNRPGFLLSALCAEGSHEKLAELIFKESSAFGLRMEKVVRLKLARRFEEVQTEFGAVTVKLGMKGTAVVQASPEFESCRAVSERTGRSLMEVYSAAIRAWADANHP